MVYSLSEMLDFSIPEISELLNVSVSEAEMQYEKADQLMDENKKAEFSLAKLFEFNLIYCDGMVERVMKKIEKL